MIVATVTMAVSRENREKLLELLSSIVEPTRARPGCLSCRIYQDVNNQNLITYEERWKKPADLKHHIRSDRYRNILIAIDLSGQPPEIRFDTVSDTHGMELIEAVRGGREDQNNLAAKRR